MSTLTRIQPHRSLNKSNGLESNKQERKDGKQEEEKNWAFLSLSKAYQVKVSHQSAVIARKIQLDIYLHLKPSNFLGTDGKLTWRSVMLILWYQIYFFQEKQEEDVSEVESVDADFQDEFEASE